MPACREAWAAPPSPSRRLDLNSTTDWKFRLFDKPESVPAGVTCAEFDDKDWAKVRNELVVVWRGERRRT